MRARRAGGGDADSPGGGGPGNWPARISDEGGTSLDRGAGRIGIAGRSRNL